MGPHSQVLQGYRAQASSSALSEFPVLRPLILLVQLVLDMNPPTSPGASVFFFLIFIILSDSSRIEAPEHSCLDGG